MLFPKTKETRFLHAQWLLSEIWELLVIGLAVDFLKACKGTVE